MTAVTERVALGAAFMDKHDPGWWREDADRAIDLETLDLGRGDRCVLGQRCPAERLVEYIGGEPEDDDDEDFRYHAYASQISGMYDRADLAEWGERHGFNHLPADREVYAALTAEWKRVIAERRAEATASAVTQDDAEPPRDESDCCCGGTGEECPCEADGDDGLCSCCRNGDCNGACAAPGTQVIPVYVAEEENRNG